MLHHLTSTNLSDTPDSSFDETMAPSEEDAETVKLPTDIKFTSVEEVDISLAEYSAGGELGRGGMGSVVAAADKVLERTVALKVMLPGPNESQASRIRFEREARVLARLEHPNIVPVHATGTTEDGRPFYTMKLVKGRTLQSILDGLLKGEAEAGVEYKLDALLNVFRKICDAIAFAHHVGVVHRDLKPENIMVGEFGEVLVMDWGLAKLLGEEEKIVDSVESTGQPELAESGSLTLDGQILGTPQYMAPEQAAGRLNEIQPRTDVYSLGGILHTILTLKPPLSGTTLAEILMRIESGERNSISTDPEPTSAHCPMRRVPEALVAVVAHAMNVKLEERYASVDALASDIAAHQAGFSTVAEKASLSRRLHLWMNRNRKIVLGVVLAFTAVVYTYLGGLLHLRSEQRRLTERINEFRRAKGEFGRMRWHIVHSLQRAPKPRLGEGWQDLWTPLMARSTNVWVMGKRALVSPPGEATVLALPHVPTDDGWTLRMTVRKMFHGGALAVFFPIEGRYGTFVFDRRDDRKGKTELQFDEPRPDPLPKIDEVLTNPDGSWHILTISAEPSGESFSFRASLGDRELISWIGDPNRIHENRYWKIKDPTRLHIGSNGGNWVIESLHVLSHAENPK